MRVAVAGENYTYTETNYANPHALTGYFNGTATTTYAYDAIGNLATTTGAATSTFNWDYRNRMVRAWVAGATSTYQYDHTIARMRQVLGSMTTDYPNKFFSIATTTLTAATSTIARMAQVTPTTTRTIRASSIPSSTPQRPRPRETLRYGGVELNGVRERRKGVKIQLVGAQVAGCVPHLGRGGHLELQAGELVWLASVNGDGTLAFSCSESGDG